MRYCLIIMLLAGLIACSTTTSLPTPSPTSAVVRPTPDIPLLPAPLYVLDRGQIARIERDGATRRQLTRERIEYAGIPPISDMDIHPTAGMVYVVGAAAGDRLVRTDLDGNNPQIVYEEAGHQLSAVRWSPDGALIYLRFQNNREIRDLPDGLYRIAASGGALELVLADDPVDNPTNPSRSVRRYYPFLWDSTGNTLIVESSATFYDDCELVFWQAQRQELRRPTLPEDMQSLCGEAFWLSDGNAALFLIGPPTGPGIWQVDVQTLQAQPRTADGVLARAPFLKGDDLLFVAVDRVNDGFTFTLTRQSPDGALTRLRPPFRETPLLIRWAPDGSGIAAVVQTARGTALRWYPIGDLPAVELPQTENGVSWLIWGSIPDRS